MCSSDLPSSLQPVFAFSPEGLAVGPLLAPGLPFADQPWSPFLSFVYPAMPLITGLNLSPFDLSFLLAQLRLPGNRPLLPIDPTGIRDVLGTSNNVNNPTWGTADQLFTRETYNAFTFRRTLAEAVAQQTATGAANLPLWTQVVNEIGRAHV